MSAVLDASPASAWPGFLSWPVIILLLVVLLVRRVRDVAILFIFVVGGINLTAVCSGILGTLGTFITRNQKPRAYWFRFYCHTVSHVLLGVRWALVSGSEPLHNGRCVYLINHRSWADFFVDAHACNGDASYLSRAVIAFVLPPMALGAVLLDRIIFFHRGQTSRVKLTALVESCLGRWPQDEQRLICYPEGHRNHTAKPLPLRRGGLQAIYEYGAPVQVLIHTNKEDILSEATMSARRGVQCRIYRGRVMQSRDFADAEAFALAVDAEFQRCWTAAYDPAAVLLPHDLAR
eukprot:TRINITY_DN55801_c0_g1_i1.p1 TRINITY_DN55801_c0_g1~~TRINITY_DN55801_c0_g1_i1.p1  ORF type:complete len:291 (-),score=34.43 TRINITY_DN55801_c0_g1_i1:381-1253(-)